MSSVAVLIDTDVFSNVLLDKRRQHPGAARWRELLQGRRVVIATQTRAELLAGFLGANWGERTLERNLDQLARVPTLPVDEDVVTAYARLTDDCKRHGHALGAKIHTGDRWVAASAIAADVPLLAGDGIYRRTPGLTLLDDPPTTPGEAP